MKFYTKHRINKINTFLDKPHNKFLLWFILGIIIFLFGIFNVKADTLYNNNTISFYDNSGSSVSSVSTSYIDTINESSATLTTVSGSYGGLVVLQLSNALIENHIYSIFVNVGAESGGGQTRLSSKNCLGIGTGKSNATNSYINNCLTPEYSNYAPTTIEKARGVYYSFIASSNATFLAVPYTTATTCTNCRNYSYGYSIIDGGDTTGLTSEELNNLLTIQTNLINNSISSISTAIEDTFTNCKYNLFNAYTIDDSSHFLENGNITYSQGWFTTDYIRVSPGTTYIYSNTSAGNAPYSNYYDSSKRYISSFKQQGGVDNSLTIPSGVYYVRFSVPKNNLDSFIFYNPTNCVNVSNDTNDKLNEVNSNINDINDSLNNDDTSGAEEEASNFFGNFSTDTFGLTSIITAPLNLIQSLTSSTCTPLHIPIPFLNNKYIDLPCMSSIYQSAFGSFFTMYQTITFGIIAYWVCVRVFNQIKDFKNPEHDEIEVLDL